eukprot:TRINITY_DN10698_c0_g1_i1.p1 TRINITY_DN10698_c0_g1~~TRINITY_DN10698_c0_g1_i1.p1  ORF type:complete len:154 (-),score=36.61 TRINITY_DN10698_c0_g1_i1:28-489(-)
MARRLQKEYQSITTDEEIKKWVTVELENGTDLFHWKALLLGPPNTPYADHFFDIKININEGYPFKHPDVIFVTKTYHPSILQKDGSMCQEVLGKNWSPQTRLEQVFAIIRSLLANPGAENPVEEEVAQLLNTNKEGFNKTAKEWTEKYAKKAT